MTPARNHTEGARLMYFHWQNLNERRENGRLTGERGSGLRHGRAWLRVGRVTINQEWVFGRLDLSAGITFFSGDRNDGISGHVSLPLVSLYLNVDGIIPRRLVSWWRAKVGYECDRRIDLSFHGRGVYWHVWRSDLAAWSRKIPRWRQGSFQFPWAWKHVRHVWLRPDGTVYRAPAKGEYEVPTEIMEVYPYSYTLRNGDVQLRSAAVSGEEREWRWRWFTWLPWPRKVRRSINVQFSDEVGEETGSWKGGTIGCSYDWRSGETLLDALRRMEREREF